MLIIKPLSKCYKKIIQFKLPLSLMQQSVLIERIHIKLGDDWMSIIFFNVISGGQSCSGLVVYKEMYINYSILFKWDIHFF